MGHNLDARIAIETRLATSFTAAPIHFWSANIPYKATAGQKYIALKVSESEDAFQASLGEGPQMHRYHGTIIVQIFTPEDKGSKDADDIADLIDPIFRRAQFSFGTSGTITCRTPNKHTVGVRLGWYQVNVNIMFKRDKIH